MALSTDNSYIKVGYDEAPTYIQHKEVAEENRGVNQPIMPVPTTSEVKE